MPNSRVLISPPESGGVRGGLNERGRIGYSAIVIFLLLFAICSISAQTLTVVELNCENLFDYLDDEGKDDAEYLPEATRHWTKKRYWRKLNNIAQELLSCSDEGIPDIIALCEVENDSVVHDLVRRSLLRNAGYEYLMTSSPDLRGIDVALLYRHSFFHLLSQESLRVDLKPYGGGTTRDILHVTGLLENYDTLDVYVCHWPSRFGGTDETERFRMCAASVVRMSVDSIFSIRRKPYVIIMGDMNDGPDAPALRDGLKAYAFTKGRNLDDRELVTVMDAVGQGSYKYQGEWDVYDQFVVSASLLNGLGCTEFLDADVMTAPFLLSDDDTYGGVKPFRTYNGRRYQGGYSDHLPVKMRIGF